MEKNAPPSENSFTLDLFVFPSSRQSTRKEKPIKFAASRKEPNQHNHIHSLPTPWNALGLHPVIQTFQIRFLFVWRGKNASKTGFLQRNKKIEKMKTITKKKKTKQEKKKREKKLAFACDGKPGDGVFFFLSLFFIFFAEPVLPMGRTAGCVRA